MFVQPVNFCSSVVFKESLSNLEVLIIYYTLAMST
jgi:hypothetical protein